MGGAEASRAGVVAITGATGHVGANLMQALLQAGEPLRVLVHRNGDPRILDGVEQVPGDVRDPDAIERLVAGARAVYHLAARVWISAREDDGTVRAVNVEGTRLVAEACRRHAARMVHFSSIHALADAQAGAVVDETRPLATEVGRNVAPYDRSKAQAERLVRDAAAAGLDAVIVNPTSVIGPNDFGLSAMGRTILALARGRFPALVPGGFDFVDARDVVAGARAAEIRGHRGESYLLSGEWLSVRDLAELVASLEGVRAPRLVAPMWLAQAAAPFAGAWAHARGRTPLLSSFSLRTLQGYRHISRARAVSTLAYQPRPMRETVADTLAWFRSVGQLPARRASHTPARPSP